jgi:chitin synthase
MSGGPFAWDHVPTMGDQLLVGVQQLQDVLQSTVPWFVMCMRPNDMMLAHSCDARKLTSQVNAFKLPSLIPGLQVHYNTVFSLQDFWDRYCVSLPITTGASIDTSLGLRDRCVAILQALQWNESKVGIGHDKVTQDTLRHSEKDTILVLISPSIPKDLFVKSSILHVGI